MPNTLETAVYATHSALAERLARAAELVSARSPGHDVHTLTDAFLAGTSRHLAAVNAVLLPSVRTHLGDGHKQAHAYVRQVRRLEVALAQAKARLYGEAHAIHRPWVEVWSDVHSAFAENCRLQQDLLRQLTEKLGPESVADLARRLRRAELRSPTRPHPYTPHDGVMGRMARRVWATADRVWDAAEGRVVPAPVEPPEDALPAIAV